MDRIQNPKLNASALIDSLDNGDVSYELACKTQEVVRAVKETGKAGSISLTIKISPMAKFGAAAVAIMANIKQSIPQREYKQSNSRRMTERWSETIRISVNSRKLKSLSKVHKDASWKHLIRNKYLNGASSLSGLRKSRLQTV